MKSKVFTSKVYKGLQKSIIPRRFARKVGFESQEGTINKLRYSVVMICKAMRSVVLSRCVLSCSVKIGVVLLCLVESCPVLLSQVTYCLVWFRIVLCSNLSPNG